MSRRVQQIVALRTASHEETVVAAARASVHAWLQTADDPAWAPWLRGRFIKVVRRATATQMASLVATAPGHGRCADGVAVAFTPSDDVRADVGRLQVCGFERPRTGVWPRSALGPHLAINPAVTMSTGKLAAQLAHGLFVWALTRTLDDLQSFACAGLPLSVDAPSPAAWAALLDAGSAHIADAGYTEVPSGSITVAIRGLTVAQSRVRPTLPPALD